MNPLAQVAPRPGEDRWLTWGLALFAFSLPITISISEAVAFALVPLWWWRCRRAGAPGPRPAVAASLLAVFFAIALLASLMGLRPAHSLDKLLRFALLGVAFLIPALDRAGRGLAARLALAFVAGAAIKAGYDVVRIPLGAIRALPGVVANGAGPALPHAVSAADQALFNQGTMRDPQYYLAGLCLVVAAWAAGGRRLRDPAVWGAIALFGAALTLHFKRGALFGAGAALALLALMSRRFRLLGVLAAVGLALCALPQFRDRVAMVQNEFSLTLKGRYALWTQAAPALLRDYPFGVGWKALRYEDLRARTKFVQHGLNHLHNNALQVAVDTGWLGLAAWLAWMAAEGVRLARGWPARRREGGATAGVQLGAFCGFIGLMLVGLVEYNFGDTEIFMLLALLWGIGAAAAGSPEPRSA